LARERHYELVFVVSPAIDAERIEATATRINQLIQEEGGKLLSNDNWGMRRLAYPIQDFKEGTYYFSEFELDSSRVPKINSTLQASQDILRHLVVRIDKKAIQPEPASTEVIQPQPAGTQETQPQPADTQAIQPEPASTEVIQPQPADTQAIQPEPASTEVIQPEPADTQAIQPEPPSTEVIQPQPADTQETQPQPPSTEEVSR